MAKLKKAWRLFPAKRELVRELSRNLNISEFIAQALINRGITDEKAANKFLRAGSDCIADPYLLKDMRIAVARIAQAIEDQQVITVYGDYDVDGITACVIVYKTLTRLGANAQFYIPDRQSEGYGLNAAALASLIEGGTKLVITVDCGISALKEISDVKGQLDIIVTDHHQPPEQLPVALAIINPKQPECPYPEKNLAGVGVAFKLCQALWQHYDCVDNQFDYLDIVAVGTIADIVPLTGENRVLVKLGLERLKTSDNIGLQALLSVCGLTGKPVNSGSVGFVIAPRLNAAGRVSQATVAVELLLTDNADRARQLAMLLDAENAARQAIEKTILSKAEEQLAAIDISAVNVLVLAGQEWHSGVIGIVASRLVDKYYKPVVMISVQDGYGKGSCRSIPAFDIYAALTQCSDLLIQFGGHRQAAGLTIAAQHIPLLCQRLQAIAAVSLSEADYIPVLNIDSLLPLSEINAAFVEQLSCLEPYGFGNPSPVFVCKDVELAEKRSIGQQSRHLKLTLKNSAVSDVIAWNMGELTDSLTCNHNIDLVFVPKYNEWQGLKKLQLSAYDVRQSIGQRETEMLAKIAPDRDCIKFVYLTIKEFNTLDQRRLSLQDIAGSILSKHKVSLSEKVITMAINVLRELHLLTPESGNGELDFVLEPSPHKKLELLDSDTFRESVKIRQEYVRDLV